MVERTQEPEPQDENPEPHVVNLSMSATARGTHGVLYA